MERHASGVSEVKIWKALGDFSRNAEDRGADGDVLLDPSFVWSQGAPHQALVKMQTNTQNKRPGRGVLWAARGLLRPPSSCVLFS